MPTKPASSLRRLALVALAAGALAAAAPRAHAAFVLTLAESGADVVITGAGSVNYSALTNSSAIDGALGRFGPSYAYVMIIGAGTAYQGITGPTSFGPGDIVNASSSTGSLIGVYGGGHYLYVPASYVAGTFTSGTETYANKSFASLGFTPGTYTYTWGSGATADSMTVTSVVPEPSTWAAVALGAGLLGVVTLRRRAV